MGLEWFRLEFDGSKFFLANLMPFVIIVLPINLQVL